MKNFKKLTLIIGAILFLISIATTFCQGQELSVKERLTIFVTSLGSNGTQAQNIIATNELNKRLGTNYVYLWDAFVDMVLNKNTTPLTNKEFVNVNTVNNTPVDTTVNVKSMIDTISTIKTIDSTYNTSEFVPNIVVPTLKEGDILLADQNDKNYTMLYNYTQKRWYSKAEVDNTPTTEVCLKFLTSKQKEVIGKNTRVFIVGSYSKQRAESKIRCMKGVFAMKQGKDEHFKRTDTKLSIPVIAEYDPCRGRYTYFVFFKGKSNKQ